MQDAFSWKKISLFVLNPIIELIAIAFSFITGIYDENYAKCNSFDIQHCTLCHKIVYLIHASLFIIFFIILLWLITNSKQFYNATKYSII